MKIQFSFLKHGLIAIALLLSTRFAIAETTRPMAPLESTSRAQLEDVKPSSWSIEGQVQAHSVAGPASPWFGLGGAFHILESLQLGLRGFVPLEHTVDNSTYSIQGFARERFYSARRTDLFVEAELSENFYNFIPFTSYGLALGVMNHVTPQVAVGLTGGFEFAHAVIDSVGLENRSDTIVYPKVALLANFGF